MSNYADTLSQHRRLTILRYLVEANQANVSILTDICMSKGVRSTRDQVLTEVLWLTENNMTKHEGDGDFVLVTIRERGAEIAQGQATHPGVKRPRYEA